MLPAQISVKTDEVSCRAFVQEFYGWYTALYRRNDRTHEARTAMDIALRERPKAFDSDLLRMLRKDSAAQAKARDIVGLDFDPFFNSQDPSPKFEARRVGIREGHCRVFVTGVDQRVVREQVEPELILRIRRMGLYQLPLP